MFGHVEPEATTIFAGKTGTGKTTNAMNEILHFWRQGKPVWVNFPIAKLPEWKSKKIIEQPIWYEEDPAGILAMRGGLFVLDEAYLKLNARKWQDLKDDVFVAFTHVRKLHMTVIVIAQSWMTIDVNVRRIAKNARLFHGSKFFGRLYNFEEYEINELGEIIKQPEPEYETAHRSFSLVPKATYEAFDTDYLFQQKPLVKNWPRALGYRPGTGTGTAAARPPGGQEACAAR